MPRTKTQTPQTDTQFHTSDSPVGKICFALIQTNFWVGDIAGNVKKMHALTLDAKNRGADIVIFPALALIGCPPEDLLLRPTLGERVREAMAKLAEIEGIVVILGYPHIDHHGTFNSAAILQGGSQKGFYHKQYLSNYGVFDERRYFQKGRNHVLFDYKGASIGLLICEDIWHDAPITALKNEGADMVVVINASPFEIGKQTARKQLLTKQSQTHQLPIVYVNTVGSQDDIVFDGGSLIVQADGSIAHEGSRFLNQLIMANYDVATQTFDTQSKAPLVLSEESEMYQALVVGLRDYVNRSGFKGVIVGLSGGIDSALTLCIAVDALGSDRVYAVMMPYEYTAQISLEDAEAQAARLNVSYTVCPIHDAVAGLRASLAPLLANSEPDVTEENLQARARGTILMALSNKFGHMVISTGNKSENAVGYATLYGDMVGGFDVLKDIYKTDVYRLANYRNRLEDNPVIPQRVIDRPPSAELRPEQTDQDSLPDYEVLDGILRMYIDEDLGYKAIVAAGFDPQTVERVLSLVDRAEYKRRQAAIGTKITKKSFGRDRRYPLVNGWSIKGDFA
ncbi:NAD+ synthase [Moraxella cuniculi]|uniref:Glutamine-dependent NAD(+) synthetase n=1 Tax=Moraxella cuniculi TaxID=34061 RepID=A0A3S5EFS3_9GAMM|nr:NAD+ synthase [Moraxella cuniculi]VEG12174.1 Glutamine-dependent NAD(+) synthetase [Moraxella cuniculi]